VLDANQDGINDVVVATSLGTGNGLEKLYLGQGSGGVPTGSFGSESVYSIGADPYQITVGDVDGDGRSDLLVSAYLSNFVAVMRGACITDPNAPAITRIRDVPNDQGGKVYVTWTASALDVPGGSVNGYRVWRLVPPASALAQTIESSAFAASVPDPSRDATMRRTGIGPDGALEVDYWEALATLPAQRFPGYGYTAATPQDSMASGNPYSVYLITATTANIDVFYSSAVDSGYSVDNIAPEAPHSLAAQIVPAGVALQWQPNIDPDLASYHLYRGVNPNFVPSADNLVAAPTDVAYVDPNGGPGYTYRLSAIDKHGNEGAFASVSLYSTTGVGDGANLSFALHGAIPNPSRDGNLTLSFSLASGAPARIEVLDLAGRSVASRSLAGLAPGPHLIPAVTGGRLAPGIYLVRLIQGPRVLEKKAAVIR
jgi:hypothetical protein